MDSMPIIGVVIIRQSSFPELRRKLAQPPLMGETTGSMEQTICL
jgi:hypothetical protein